MSSLDKVIPILNRYFSISKFLKDNYPEILAKWAQAQKTHRQQDEATTLGTNQNGYNT